MHDEPLFTAIFEVIDGRIQLSPRQVEAFELPDQLVAVYRADQVPAAVTREQVANTIDDVDHTLWLDDYRAAITDAVMALLRGEGQ